MRGSGYAYPYAGIAASLFRDSLFARAHLVSTTNPERGLQPAATSEANEGRRKSLFGHRCGLKSALRVGGTDEMRPLGRPPLASADPGKCQSSLFTQARAG